VYGGSRARGKDTYKTPIIDDLLFEKVRICNVSEEEDKRQFPVVQVFLHPAPRCGYLGSLSRNADHARCTFLQEAFCNLIACRRNLVSDQTTGNLLDPGQTKRRLPIPDVAPVTRQLRPARRPLWIFECSALVAASSCRGVKGDEKIEGPAGKSRPMPPMLGIAVDGLEETDLRILCLTRSGLQILVSVIRGFSFPGGGSSSAWKDHFGLENGSYFLDERGLLVGRITSGRVTFLLPANLGPSSQSTFLGRFGEYSLAEEDSPPFPRGTSPSEWISVVST
jgi:hypothetical protein